MSRDGGSIPPASTSLRFAEAKAAAPKLVRAKAGILSLSLRSCEATARHAIKREQTFYYVYILESQTRPTRHYTGFTGDLDQRLRAHNDGACPHTSKWRPWRIKTAVAFTDRRRALDFERYLKSPSGRAFSKKRL